MATVPRKHTVSGGKPCVVMPLYIYPLPEKDSWKPLYDAYVVTSFVAHGTFISFQFQSPLLSVAWLSDYFFKLGWYYIPALATGYDNPSL